jgi:hypothetical protein
LGNLSDKIFEGWRREALQVEYSATIRAISEAPSGTLLPFVITICPHGYDKHCFIELNFFSSQGELS